MRKPRWLVPVALAAVLSIVAAACKEDTTTTDGTEPTAGQDLLAQIQAEGVIRVSTDPAYAPQSFLDPDTGEWEGFDIDVAEEIAVRLGATVEWETPKWNAITSGGWADRWDMSVGSMTVTPERQEVLNFSPAYYYTPAAVAVHTDNTSVADVAVDLDGAKIGVCGSCTYDFYLQKNLDVVGETIDFVIDDADIVNGYETDTDAIRDLTLGDGVRLDAVISALPTLQEAINAGEPIKVVGDPLYHEPLAVAFDRESSLDAASLVEEVGGIIEEMHQDGTLSELSNKWYGYDLTVKTS